MIRKEFEKWAISLAGSDGGDIQKSKIWFCGIEWGGNIGEKYYEDLRQEFKRNQGFRSEEYNYEEQEEYSFSRRMHKLLSVILTGTTKNYSENIKNEKILKLNLLPIAFRDNRAGRWSDPLKDSLGFNTKWEYESWCLLNRGPKFRQLVKKHRPDIIVCLGMTYKDTFFSSFVPDSEEHRSIELRVYQLECDGQSNKKNRVVYHSFDGYTHVYVLPFLSGAHGLNSDSLLQQAGLKIRESYKGETVKKSA